MIKQYVVTVDVPNGVPEGEMCSYIEEAVGTWRGQMDPEEALFDLNSKTVKAVPFKRKILGLLRQAYLEGFNDSGEGRNGEYPFCDNGQSPEESESWCTSREVALKSIINQPKKEKKDAKDSRSSSSDGVRD